ncbi:Mtch-1p [Globodera pallida]|nr:Mtch-1p [Globodera pallida]
MATWQMICLIGTKNANREPKIQQNSQSMAQPSVPASSLAMLQQQQQQQSQMLVQQQQHHQQQLQHYGGIVGAGTSRADRQQNLNSTNWKTIVAMAQKDDDLPNADIFNNNNNNCKERQIPSTVVKALLRVAGHPITFANTLIRLGHEPYPLSRGNKWIMFGEPVYFQPNIFEYLTNVCQSHGYMTICTGFGANLMAFFAYDIFSNFTGRFMDQHYPEIGGRMDDNMLQMETANTLDNYQLFRLKFRQTIRDTISHFVGTVVARPFIVIMVRQIAQHITNEYKYQSFNFLQPLLHIGALEGPAGFFSGLVPQLIGEFAFIWGAALVGYGFKLAIKYFELDQAASDQQQPKSMFISGLRWFCRSTLCQYLSYPFYVVSTLIAITGSGLAISMLPFSPLFTHWADAYAYLLPYELRRGQLAFLRHELGPVSLGADGKLYASKKHFI